MVPLTIIHWWKKIGLVGNPFPSDQGLLGIPIELYDDIVVRTRFVDTYLTKAEENPEDFLGQSIAILGEFGSGKTTLIDMVCFKLGSKGILPCKVILMPSPDTGAIILELLKQLGMQLNKIINKLIIPSCKGQKNETRRFFFQMGHNIKKKEIPWASNLKTGLNESILSNP